jgi:hypothetical protein
MFKTGLAITSICSSTTFIMIYTYLGLIELKAWIFDEARPNFINKPISRLVCHFGNPKDVWADSLIFCVCMWTTGFILCFILPAWKIVVPLALLAGSGMGGAHALRWAVRTKRVIDRCKESKEE